MKREFLSRPEQRGHAVKRKQGAEDVKGAHAGLPQFQKHGGHSAGEQESQADSAANAAASSEQVYGDLFVGLTDEYRKLGRQTPAELARRA